MSWILLLQMLILMGASTFLVLAATYGIIDKRREDAHHRKENGL